MENKKNSGTDAQVASTTKKQRVDRLKDLSASLKSRLKAYFSKGVRIADLYKMAKAFNDKLNYDDIYRLVKGESITPKTA